MLITTNPKSKTKSKSSPPPSFYIDANTFNSPLSLDVSQQPLPSTVSPVFIHAGNNLGEVEVTVDKYFQGSFLVQTEYATAELEDGSIDSEVGFDDGLVASDNYLTDWAGRNLYVDASADSIVSGWGGEGERPESSKPGVGAPGCVEVLSVLSPVELSLGGS
ncbi:hypothetical protein NLI96_g8644 [Meripilus lineatus]|uniref:Uncharacterized protein n=1 Tax=Meripilus lineatus TaxID=2056292 RepID=A0AAD5UYR1_9APHY|nr:hypothetical protein NLI96_g8644 [Physisporinus lineatus]